MRYAELTQAALELSPEERFDLLSTVWDSVADDAHFVPTQELRALLEARIADGKQNPDAGISVADGHAQIRRALASIRS